MNATHYSARASWVRAYRMARAHAWGSLHCSGFGRPVVELAKEAAMFGRGIWPVHRDILTRQRLATRAVSWRALGYYKRGLARSF